MNKILPNEYCNLKFNKTVTRWDEAIPLGNGLCGTLIWGSSRGLRFSLDRGDIWDTTPFAGIVDERFTYPMMVKWAKEENIDEIRQVFDAPYNHVLPTKLPAGKIIFDFFEDVNVCSELNLAKAEATITVGETLKIESFLHAEQKVGMIRINRKRSAFSFHIENPEYSRPGENKIEKNEQDSVNTGSLKLLTYPEPEIMTGEETSWFVQKISPDFSYGVFVKVKELDEATEIAYLTATAYDGENWREKALKQLSEALVSGYEELLQSHAKWWSDYWRKSSISLPDALFEKNWYIAQYLLGSCSRKGSYPMPLQGVWTADDGKLPPWKGDYHLDLNVQMSYYSYLKANHLEEGESLLDFLWNMADCGRNFAKSFYHSEGLCLPSTMTLNGDPLGGWGMYSLSPTNQLWLCQAFERHYRATGDKKFLEEKAYPYLKETAEFILGLLEEKDGFYYLPISSTPEVHDDNIESFVTPNSNYDLSLMRYLFRALLRLSEEMGNNEAQKWEEILTKFPELAVNEKGVLKLSPDENLEESHRHFSHAMCIHPLRLMPYEGENNKRVIDATVLDLERLGTGYWVGFSWTWMAELYAIQQNGNGAAYQLRVFWEQYCSQNGFHLNGDYKKCGTSTFHYRPFTLEANFCAADALQEMLLQSEDNVLNLFPALPDAWMERKVEFENFRAEKGLLVSAVLENGSVTTLVLKPEYNMEISLLNTAKTEKMLERLSSDTAPGKCAALKLEGGEEYHFDMKG